MKKIIFLISIICIACSKDIPAVPTASEGNVVSSDSDSTNVTDPNKNEDEEVSAYRLVYSSETPEACKASLGTETQLTQEELNNCTGDFMSQENLERHWYYSKKQSSMWNKRMGTTDEEHYKVHLTDNGTLKLLATSQDGTKDGFITSGVEMYQGYQYGIFQVKAKVNPYVSNFPAVWMMPTERKYGWPDCGEIDIMEQIGTSSTVYSTVHLGARYSHNVGKSYSWSGNRWFNSQAHVYTLKWDEDSLVFYTDDTKVFKYAKDSTLDLKEHPDYEFWQFPYNQPFHLMLDQALGHNYNWGTEDPDPSHTYEMDIEYVRIFQKK